MVSSFELAVLSRGYIVIFHIIAQLSRTAFAINQVQESAGGTIMRKGWSGGLTESRHSNDDVNLRVLSSVRCLGPKELSPDRELVAQAAEVQQQGSRAQTRGSLSQVALSKSAASTERKRIMPTCMNRETHYLV